MLHRRTRVGVTLDAQPCEQPNPRVIRFRQRVRRAAAHRRDAPGCMLLLPLRHAYAFLARSVWRAISAKSGLRLAPPTSDPSISGMAAKVAALAVVTLPPYCTRITDASTAPYISTNSART